MLSRHKLWYLKNREREILRAKRWREENRELHIIYHRRWRERNIEKCRLSHKKWRDKNREKNNLSHSIKYKLCIDNLMDPYIIRLLCNRSSLTSSDIPEELIEAKRLYIKIRRLIEEKMKWESKKSRRNKTQWARRKLKKSKPSWT